MPVVDASVLVEYLAGGEHAERARDALLGGNESLWAPHLVDAEVGHVLRRAARVGEIDEATARAALTDLAGFPIRRAAHTGLFDRAWELRANVTFYDALYVALAERLGLRFVTFDARLIGAPDIRAHIEILS